MRLGKGDTIGSALQKLGFAAETIAASVSALAPHVSLKRLPIGLGITLQIRPSAEEDAKPILQALTLHPEGRREITVERDDEGHYVVELPDAVRRPGEVGLQATARGAIPSSFHSLASASSTGAARYTLLEPLEPTIDPCTHSFQPLLKLVVLCFELVDPGRKLVQLPQQSIQATLDIGPVLSQSRDG